MNMADGNDDTGEREDMNLSEQLANEELVELLAAKEHESWARWMSYLFSRCLIDDLHQTVVPDALVAQWKRQAATPYERLSEQEKQSDRDEVAHILPIIHEHFYPRELLLSELKQTLREYYVAIGNMPAYATANDYIRVLQPLQERTWETLGDAHVGGKEE